MKSIQSVIRDAEPHWVGDGFPVRSLFSYRDGAEFDPFLLLDYAGPYEFAPSEAKRGVGEHPHRGFETVTLIFQGELEHRDSGGGKGAIGPGDVQWMTAASGVVHEEFHSERFAREGGTLEMIQLWVNLPSGKKMGPPRYQDLLDSQIPRVPLRDGRGTVRVIAGDFAGTSGAAQTFTPIQLWDVEMASGSDAEFSFPAGQTAMLVVQSGEVEVNGSESLGPTQLLLLGREGDRFRIVAGEASRFIVLGGEPIGEPVVGHGPFVMNTQEQIREAILDYQSGRMGRLT